MHTLTRRLVMGISAVAIAACTGIAPETGTTEDTTPIASPPEETADQVAAQPPQERQCILVEDGFGPQGQVSIRVEEVVTGLEVPWGIVFLENGDLMVTERPGRIRLVQNGQLRPEPIATVNVSRGGEGGLLGMAAHPNFAENRLFYLYYTTDQGGTLENRVERWQLSEDGLSAQANQIIVDGIPVARFHNGGRLRFGPDGMLYIGTGDASDPPLAQDENSLAGKILRVTPDGDVPGDNPSAGNPVFLSGLRNTQGFDWYDESTLWVTDHGPSGELGRTGQDKVLVANAGDNLGWPTLTTCQDQEGLVPASLIWRDAVPPGGATIYTGDAIPEWQGDLIMGTLGSRHLHRIAFNPNNPYQVETYEVYLQDDYGRLREVIMGPDNELYVTTSNCDGRGTCPPEQDKILRVTR